MAEYIETKIYKEMKRRKIIREIAWKTLSYILLTLGAIIMVIPFVWMISTSLKEPSRVFVMPPEWIPRTTLRIKLNNQGSDHIVYTGEIDGKRTRVILTGAEHNYYLVEKANDLEYRLKDGVKHDLNSIQFSEFEQVEGLARQTITINRQEHPVYRGVIRGREAAWIKTEDLDAKSVRVMEVQHGVVKSGSTYKIDTALFNTFTPVELPNAYVQVYFSGREGTPVPFGIYQGCGPDGKPIVITRVVTSILQQYENVDGAYQLTSDAPIRMLEREFRADFKAERKIQFLWKNYAEAWFKFDVQIFGKNIGLLLPFLNSLIYAGVRTLGVVITSAMAAYAFARLNFVGRDKLFFAYLGTMMIPGQVTMIPIFIILKLLGWINSYKALLLPGLVSAYGTFMLRQFFMSIPVELEEAAFIDGASRPRIFMTLIMPLSKAAIATLTTFTFMNNWNDFMWPLVVVNDTRLQTLPLALAAFQQTFSTSWTLLMAAANIALLPVIIIYIFNQRFFTQGIVLSGLKG